MRCHSDIIQQSINWLSRRPGGHVVVGSSGDVAYIAEFNLLFYEIIIITNNEHLVDQLETPVEYELSGQKGQIFNKNVLRLLDSLDFIIARQNPFIIDGTRIPLHNIRTKQPAGAHVKETILSVPVDEQKSYKQYREERYVQKVKKISDTLAIKILPSNIQAIKP